MSKLNHLISFTALQTLNPSEGSPNAEPTESDVQGQLKRIGASRLFCKSNRLCRFLSFAANQALSGDGQRLKEVQVGIHVFDRGSAFDPRVDPIVRVEARRLRSKLKSYYASVGRDDRLLIDFPKGTYTPVFRFRPYKSKPTKRSTIAVLSFTRLTNSLLDESLGAGITEELIHHLIQIPHLQIHRELQTRDQDGNPGCGSHVTKWKIGGSVRSMRGISRVIVQLIDTTSNAYVWSETYDRAIGDMLNVQEGIAQAVIAKLKLTLRLPEPKAVPSALAYRIASA